MFLYYQRQEKGEGRAEILGGKRFFLFDVHRVEDGEWMVRARFFWGAHERCNWQVRARWTFVSMKRQLWESTIPVKCPMDLAFLTTKVYFLVNIFLQSTTSH